MGKTQEENTVRAILESDGEPAILDNPLVTIITPVLNGEKYLTECLESVLTQKYQNIEQLFVDGGSTDRTLEILAEYQKKYPGRIRIIHEPEPGVGMAVNAGFAAAKGAILCWLDSDDTHMPDTIETVVSFFQENPDAFFLYGGCNIMDASGKMLSSFVVKDFDFHEAVIRWHYIVIIAIFFRREVIERLGVLNPLGNDLDFYLRVYSQFKMHRTEKTLANWRLHGGSISRSPSKRERNIRRDRIRQDFLICLRNGGNIFSPRSIRFYVSLLMPLADLIRPVFGRSYPALKKMLGFDVRTSNNRSFDI